MVSSRRKQKRDTFTKYIALSGYWTIKTIRWPKVVRSQAKEKAECNDKTSISDKDEIVLFQKGAALCEVSCDEQETKTKN